VEGEVVKVRFFLEEATGVPGFEVADDRYGPLGSLLTREVQIIDKWALDVLDDLTRIQLGQAKRAEWLGNGWSGEISPNGLHLEDLHSDDWRGDYSLDLAREVTLEYVCFLLPDVDARSAALVRWEAEEGRPHAARADVIVTKV